MIPTTTAGSPYDNIRLNQKPFTGPQTSKHSPTSSQISMTRDIYFLQTREHFPATLHYFPATTSLKQLNLEIRTIYQLRGISLIITHHLILFHKPNLLSSSIILLSFPSAFLFISISRSSFCTVLVFSTSARLQSAKQNYYIFFPSADRKP